MGILWSEDVEEYQRLYGSKRVYILDILDKEEERQPYKPCQPLPTYMRKDDIVDER